MLHPLKAVLICMRISFIEASRAAVSAKRKMFVPLKEKDIDTQGTNRKHMFEELKKTVPNGCCTSFMQGTMKQMSHLRFLLLLMQIYLPN